MDKKKQYFGYDEEQIREAFRNSKDQVDTNSKIEDTSTLSQLVESSDKLLKYSFRFRDITKESMILMLEPYYYEYLKKKDAAF